MKSEIRLLLFDIDGTLMRTAGAGREAMNRTFEKVYGIRNAFNNIMMMGRTDPGILYEALENYGLARKEEEIERFRETYFWILDEEIEIPRSGKHLCPGVVELLDALQNEKKIIIGLLTGNWRYSALIKLRYFGIDEYFTIGAFADDSSERKDLVPIVIEKLQKQRHFNLLKHHIFVIGDTPLDIRCARPHGVRTLGVATGFHSIDDLKKESPDYYFEDLSDLEQLVDIFMGKGKLELINS